MFKSEIEYLQKEGNRLDAEVITKKTKHIGWEPSQKLAEYINKIISIQDAIV